jgi:hypothetical protein
VRSREFSFDSERERKRERESVLVYLLHVLISPSHTHTHIQDGNTIQDYGLKDKSTIHLVETKARVVAQTAIPTTAIPTAAPTTTTSTSGRGGVTMHTHALELPSNTSPEDINNLVSGIISRLGGTNAQVRVMSSSSNSTTLPREMTSTTSRSNGEDAPLLSNSWFDDLRRLNHDISTCSYSSSSDLATSTVPLEDERSSNLKSLSNALFQGHNAMHALQRPLLELSEALRRERSMNLGDRVSVTVASSRLVPALQSMSSLCNMLVSALEGVSTTTTEDGEEEKVEEKKTEDGEKKTNDVEEKKEEESNDALDDVLAALDEDAEADAEAEAESQIKLSRQASKKEKSRKKRNEKRRRAQQQNKPRQKLSMDDLRPENVVFEGMSKSEKNDWVSTLREDARVLRREGSDSSKPSDAYREMFG